MGVVKQRGIEDGVEDGMAVGRVNGGGGLARGPDDGAQVADACERGGGTGGEVGVGVGVGTEVAVAMGKGDVKGAMEGGDGEGRERRGEE